MPETIELLIHFFVSAIKLLKPGGVKVVIAEKMAMKQQLIVMNRGKKRSPVLTTSDRFLFGILAIIIGGSRLRKIAVIIKPPRFLLFTNHSLTANTAGYTRIKPGEFQVENHRIKHLLILSSKWKSAIRLSAMAVFQCRYSKLSRLPSAALLLAEYCGKTRIDCLLVMVPRG